MLRIIEIDPKSKEHDSIVYVVPVGDEKIGLSEAELLEIVRAKLTKSQNRKSALKAARSNINEVSDEAIPSWNERIAGQ